MKCPKFLFQGRKKFLFNVFCNYVRKLKFCTFSCPFHEMVTEFLVHFMKWTANLTISRNGQVSHPFHEMVNFVVHFMKWTISHLGRNIYIYLKVSCIYKNIWVKLMYNLISKASGKFACRVVNRNYAMAK